MQTRDVMFTEMPLLIFIKWFIVIKSVIESSLKFYHEINPRLADKLHLTTIDISITENNLEPKNDRSEKYRKASTIMITSFSKSFPLPMHYLTSGEV